MTTGPENRSSFYNHEAEELKAATQELSAEFTDAHEIAGKLEAMIAGNVYLGKLNRQVLVGAICLESAVLLEGAPSTGKTTIAKTTAKAISGTFGRIQGTPDLQPTDITGVDIYHPGHMDFEFRKGPIFNNILLIDEINRMPSKTQSSLLEGMEERTVTVGGNTYILPRPFVVLATQNPHEDGEGTSRIGKATLDRFPVSINLPKFDAETAVSTIDMPKDPKQAVEIDQINDAKNGILSVVASRDEKLHAARIVVAAREAGEIEYEETVLDGIRPAQYMINMAKALALQEKAPVVDKRHIDLVARFILPHRMTLNFTAQRDKVTKDSAIEKAIKEVYANTEG